MVNTCKHHFIFKAVQQTMTMKHIMVRSYLIFLTAHRMELC